MNKFIIWISTCLLAMCAYAQSPNWQVNENEFEYTMTMVAYLNINGKQLASTNDKLGAFVNGQCRGVANLIYAESVDSYYAYLTVFSNTSNETVTFKIYDSSTNSTIDANQTLPFEINKHYGNVSGEFGFSNPSANYFRKNALNCNNTIGAIKVKFDIDNLKVTLEQNNSIVKESTIKNKEAEFTNLASGVYVLKVNGGLKKTITINIE